MARLSLNSRNISTSIKRKKANHTRTSVWLRAWLIKIKKCKSQFSLWTQINLMLRHPLVVKHSPTFYQLRIWVCQLKVRSLEALEKCWNRIDNWKTICDIRGTLQRTLKTTLLTIPQPLCRAPSSQTSLHCDLQLPSALELPLTKRTGSSRPQLTAALTQKDTPKTRTIWLRVRLW